MNYHCSFCGKNCEGKKFPHNYCQSCYRYFIIEKKSLYPIPSKGVIGRTPSGEVICPYCGKAMGDLSTHCRQSHNLSHKELCDEQGYNYRASLTSIEVSKKLSKLAKYYNMGDQLRKVGASTRIKKGQTLRLGHPNREQSLNRLKRK